ncbi:PREDICTED: uncharacterized protein LOC105565836 [Vollenhovia emeryi]|uniref:uncharacterized protein LOC105565836 n=1 Tax=Vollenhovia emeryi TaxID=411798 RepID=UPI0005F4C5AD|nr:PREDICTED: uncharacterized protein LOC105565836 [Vollenhovia emeryi]
MRAGCVIAGSSQLVSRFRSRVFAVIRTKIRFPVNLIDHYFKTQHFSLYNSPPGLATQPQVVTTQGLPFEMISRRFLLRCEMLQSTRRVYKNLLGFWKRAQT